MTQKKSKKSAAEKTEVVMGFATAETIVEKAVVIDPPLKSFFEEVVSDETVEAPKVETEFDIDEPAMPDTYFGKGEFAITKKNIEKLTFAVKEYNEKNIWCWKLQDQLGINRNGKLSKKFTDATDTLIELKVPQVEALFAEMLNVKPKEEADVIYDKRPATIDKSLRREEVKLLLTSVEGLTEVEINKMVKAI